MSKEVKNNEANGSNVSFARDLGCFDATMIGVGALIGAGVFVLTGLAADVAGPSAILAFALNGIVTLFTAFSYIELASAIPEAGGGYAFTRRAMPGLMGYLSGWMLWFAYTVACALYASGFASYFMEFLDKYFHGLHGLLDEHLGWRVSVGLFTVLISTFFIYLNVRGAEVTGKAENFITVTKIIILFIFILFGLTAIFGDFGNVKSNFTPFLHDKNGITGILLAMGLIFIAFEGYDLIATVSEEVKDPERNIPRAIIYSLSIAVAIYLLIVFVALGAIKPEGGLKSWQILSSGNPETAMATAASKFMPSFGVMLIIFGALFSTMSALNATILASSRVAFSMGRDRWLPNIFSRIHPVKRTPYIAVIATGGLLLIMALFFPIEIIGGSASQLFLLTFILVNLSAIILRRKHPDIKRLYKMPFYPVTPLLGIATCAILAIVQIRYNPVIWFISLAWIGSGILIYYVFIVRFVKPEPVAIGVAPVTEVLDVVPYRILVPLHNPRHISLLLDIAIPLAKANKGEIIALTAVLIPRQLPLRDGFQYVPGRESLLKEARKYARKFGVKIKTDTKITHHVSDAIIQTAREYKCSQVIMGWKGRTLRKERIFGEITDRLIRYAPCDLMVIKFGVRTQYEKILLPTAGGPNAILAGNITGQIFSESTTPPEITIGYFSPKSESEEMAARATEALDKTAEAMNTSKKPQKSQFPSTNVVASIIEEAKNYDLLIIGSAKESLFKLMLFGEIPETVARYSDTTVIVVKKYEGAVKSWLKQWLG